MSDVEYIVTQLKGLLETLRTTRSKYTDARARDIAIAITELENVILRLSFGAP